MNTAGQAPHHQTGAGCPAAHLLPHAGLSAAAMMRHPPGSSSDQPPRKTLLPQGCDPDYILWAHLVGREGLPIGLQGDQDLGANRQRGQQLRVEHLQLERTWVAALHSRAKRVSTQVSTGRSLTLWNECCSQCTRCHAIWDSTRQTIGAQQALKPCTAKLSHLESRFQNLKTPVSQESGYLCDDAAPRTAFACSSAMELVMGIAGPLTPGPCPGDYP